MGIFPFATPAEIDRMMRNSRHYEDFCKLRGYTKIEMPSRYPPPLKGEFLAKDGKIYADSDLFKSATGWYPYYVKEGICYGWYEPFYNDGYIHPFEDECKFLVGKGYQHVAQIVEDYLENIIAMEEHFKKYGYVPRWIKDGKTFGHEQLLKAEGYKYEGFPSLG